MLLGTLTIIYILYALSNNYNFNNELIMNKTLFVVFALLYPLIDLLRVFILRIKDGASPFVADQRHLHHVLLKKLEKPFITLLSIELIYALVIGFLFTVGVINP